MLFRVLVRMDESRLSDFQCQCFVVLSSWVNGCTTSSVVRNATQCIIAALEPSIVSDERSVKKGLEGIAIEGNHWTNLVSMMDTIANSVGKGVCMLLKLVSKDAIAE